MVFFLEEGGCGRHKPFFDSYERVVIHGYECVAMHGHEHVVINAYECVIMHGYGCCYKWL